MFDFVRSHTRLTLGFMLLLIIPSFVFFGVDGYRRFSGGGNTMVAKVDGQSVTQDDWERAHQRVVEQARRQAPQADPRLFDSPQARRDTLDQLLRARAIQAAARDQHLAPGDARLQRIFQSDPQFAGLRNPDGSVNRELLATQGMSSELFVQRLRDDLATQQVLAGVGTTALVPTQIADTALDALLQRREIQLQRFDPASYRAQVQPSDADIEAYYKAHEGDFRTTEQARIEYVVLDLDVIAKGVTLTDDELRRFYADNAARFTTPEERRARHILIKADKAMPAAERDKARAKAEGLLAEVRKTPAAFAELAKKNSDDPGSAAQGGDLDFFGRGAMVKPFEDAAFKLAPGETSGIVESDFGFHIINLVAVRGGDKKPFEQVRAVIEAELRKAAAQKKYPAAAEQFTNTVYEQSDSLQPVIDKLKLDKKTATVQRQPAVGSSGPLASGKLLDAVFASETLRNQRNTDAVEVGPNQLVAARVVQHLPARTLPLAEVKAAVLDKLVAEQAAARARKDGAARLAALQKSPDEALPGPALTVSRGQPQGLPRAIVDAALRVDAGKLPATSGVDLGEQGYAVLRIVKVLPREAVPGGDAPMRAQLAQLVTRAEVQAYEAALKRRYKVEIKPASSVFASADAASGASR